MQEFELCGNLSGAERSGDQPLRSPAAAELAEAAGLMHERLSARIGQPRSRSKISRLANERIHPPQAEILKILDALGVECDRRDRLLEVARDAVELGWWIDYDKELGLRQAVCSDLDAGASRIREFHRAGHLLSTVAASRPAGARPDAATSVVGEDKAALRASLGLAAAPRQPAGAEEACEPVPDRH
ncbi:helix-turn-helix domain-containing protein [Amycolatopsis sp. NPDC004079]|uniref:helix-turn-helix domain-containing protein n=1 Tax=Amycolatopsis sp. NPDC004079 TaxID=3154549 RepID=UPI0033A23296